MMTLSVSASCPLIRDRTIAPPPNVLSLKLSQTSEVCGHPEIRRPANTNGSQRQGIRNLLCSRLEPKDQYRLFQTLAQDDTSVFANTVFGARDFDRNLLCSHLELSTRRSRSSITNCCDVCQSPKSLLVSLSRLAHSRTIYFALHECKH